MPDGSPHLPLRHAEESIASALRRDEHLSAAIQMLLAAAGQCHDCPSPASALERFVAGGNASRFAGIRRFFLDPEETYGLAELSKLWQISVEDVKAVYEDEIEAWQSRAGGGSELFIVRWPDAVGATMARSLFRPLEIELALAQDFSRAFPDHWRVRPLFIALPQWAVSAIEREGGIPSTSSIEARIEQLLLLVTRARDGTAWR